MKKFSALGLLIFGLIGCSLETAPLPEAEPIALEIAQVEPTLPPATATSIPTRVVDPIPTQEPTAMPTDIPTEIPTEVPPTPTLEPTSTPTEEPIVEKEEVAEAAAPYLPGTELFTFIAGEPGWYTVDDDVMGGISDSQVSFVESGQLYFYGNMSLDNNGGFSSARSDWQKMDLTGKDGILLRVKGDGLVYRLRIRTDTAGRGVSYNALFQTQADEWSIVYIPFAQMVPTVRGFVVDTGQLDTANIGSFGFMLSDKQPGEFELLVDWMRAVSDEEIEAIQNG
ncbi:MAG: CIA30 family protein [Chloroflexota bacterium]